MTQTEKLPDSQPLDELHTQFEDALIDNLTGEWKLSRKIGARLEENHFSAQWVLNHQFLQLHMKDVKTPPKYEALVYIGYDPEYERYVVYWLDTFGGKFSEKGTGKREGNAIRFVFQYPDGQLRNTFSWDIDTTTWRCVVEQQDEKGGWSLFCEDRLQRS